jgi:hypothetical protein
MQSACAEEKAKGKKQKAKGKRVEVGSVVPTFAFCFLPFAF